MHVFTLCHVGSTYPLFGAAVTSFLYVSYSPAGNKQKGEILRCLFNEKSGVRKPRHQRLVFRILPIALCIQNASAPGITIGSVGTKHSDYTFRVRVLPPPAELSQHVPLRRCVCRGAQHYPAFSSALMSPKNLSVCQTAELFATDSVLQVAMTLDVLLSVSTLVLICVVLRTPQARNMPVHPNLKVCCFSRDHGKGPLPFMF